MSTLDIAWSLGGGGELCRRMEALAEEWRIGGAPTQPWEVILDVLNNEYNPLPDQLPELGDPPRLRPAVPGRGYFRLPRDIAESEPRRAREPGE